MRGVCWICQQRRKRTENGEDGDDAKAAVETLYAAIPFLAKISDDGDGDEMDRVLVQRTVDMLNKVSEARNVRETASHDTVHW